MSAGKRETKGNGSRFREFIEYIWKNSVSVAIEDHFKPVRAGFLSRCIPWSTGKKLAILISAHKETAGHQTSCFAYIAG